MTITFRVEDDNTPEEVEQFVLEVTNAQLAEFSTGTPLQVFFTNSTTVTIGDDDGKCVDLISLTLTSSFEFPPKNSVISIQFRDQEIAVEESMEGMEIHFTITNPISVDTHYVLLAMTYEEYDDQYAGLRARYPGLEPFSLYNEYDAAECKHKFITPVASFYASNDHVFNCLFAVEDFSSRRIPFTVRVNSTEPEDVVVITLINDNRLEPIEEGFRLVLTVDEAMTPRSYVTFELGRQLALFRIDDYTDSEW